MRQISLTDYFCKGPLLSMFKAVLPGQWHSLSDPELEHSLIARIDMPLPQPAGARRHPVRIAGTD